MKWLKFCGVCLGMGLSALLYCELLVDYAKLLQCSWPSLKDYATTSPDINTEPLRVLVLADTHLLGPLRGHWLDRLYREWHMHRAFQAAINIFQPEVVFVLGDLFDEGDLVDRHQFDAYVKRFQRLFRTPVGTPLVSAVGNHDVGFHYKMNPYITGRFKKSFNNTGVQLYTFKNVHFVLINSMAMENDGCTFCELTQRELREIKSQLNCLKDPYCKNSNMRAEHKSYSPPVLMQHFPTYRISDKVCQVYDTPVIEKFREKWEVLSKESTDLLGKLLHPRLAFAGHSHHYCQYRNRLGIDEYTVASFSWRNKINPSFLLVTLTPDKHAVFKCDMAVQSTNYSIYLVTLFTCFVLLVMQLYKHCSTTNMHKLA